MTDTIDPITVEVLGNAFASLVDEMGIALIKASYSTNIKERRDCSTALFDTQGQTLAQAEHIPIHLGSLLGIVNAVRERYPAQHIHVPRYGGHLRCGGGLRRRCGDVPGGRGAALDNGVPHIGG